MLEKLKQHTKVAQGGMGLVGIFLLILCVFFVFKVRNEARQYGYIGRAPLSQYTITISGEGKVQSVPDIALVNLGVVSEAKTVKLAQDDNTKKMNKIISAIKSMDVDKKDIQTTNYNIYPKYDYDRERGTSEIVGYNVSQSVVVKVRDLDKVGEILSRAGELGANQVGGIDFSIDDPDSLRGEARDKAIKNAKDKANALAKGLGVKLGRIVSFNEYSPTDSYYPVRAYAEGDGIGGEAPKIEAGSQEVISNVNIVFEIK